MLSRVLPSTSLAFWRQDVHINRFAGAAFAVALLSSTVATANAQTPPFPFRHGAVMPAAVAATPVPGVQCQTVSVAMRDGTLLSTDVYLPLKAGRYPVIL